MDELADMSDALIAEWDSAMCCYLGGTPSERGVMPVGMTKRLEQRYGNRATEIEKQLTEILWSVLGEADQSELWPLASLSKMGAAVERLLASQLPRFAPMTRAKIACYYTYSYR